MDTDLLTEDAIDRVWSLFGSIAHTLLEEHGSEESLTEKRFYMTVLGKVISGGVDHYKDTVITDYKVTKAYKLKKGIFSDWEAQLNCYVPLCRLYGLVVRRIRTFVFVRDWSVHELHDPRYPKTPIVEVPLTLWTPEKAKEYITERVAALVKAGVCSDAELPECTKEEMWQDDPVFAVMKNAAAKKATRLLDTRAEAEEYIAGMAKRTGEEHIVEREAVRRRCEEFCIANTVCVQYKKYKESQAKEEVVDEEV